MKINRREFLAVGTAAVGGTVMSEFAVGEGAKTSGAIDAHVHVWTPDTERYPLADGYAPTDMQPRSFTPEELFAHCRPVGVSRIVLIQMSFYGFDNSYMLDMMRAHAGTFSGVAVIDSSDKPKATMLRLKEQGVRGFRIRPEADDVAKAFQQPGLETMWQVGAEQGLAMCPLMNPQYIPVIDKLCTKYPDTPVVVDHFARIGIDGSIPKEDLDALCGLAKHRHTHVKVSAFYALGKKQAPYTDLAPMIRRVVEAFGPERCMWASDCPFQVDGGHAYKPSIDLIREHCDFLSASDREWVLGKTAERVYFS